MSNKKTRERQLAKLAARRAAERRRKRRQRLLAFALVAAVVLGTAIPLGLALTGNKKKPAAGPTPGATPSTSVTPSATPSAKGVACGGTVPKAAAEKKAQYAKPPPLTVDPSKNYTATVQTSCGTFELQLLPKVAPLAVNSFVFLARHHFYDGVTFHRIVPDFVIQGGDPTGTGSGGPGYKFSDELKNKLTYQTGTLAMANSGPDTNGSQWFVVVSENGAKQLQHLYTIFGKVLKGIDVVEKINKVPTGSDQKPLQTVYIEKITIKES
jgi:cyclophilin family peptidyl-prolyl cis-trans isomerase